MACGEGRFPPRRIAMIGPGFAGSSCAKTLADRAFSAGFPETGVLSGQEGVNIFELLLQRSGNTRPGAAYEIRSPYSRMKQSAFILSVTAAFAIAALLLARISGYREDFSSAIGGIAGFALANGVVIACRRFSTNRGTAETHGSVAIAFTYLVSAIACFSFIGWLSGYVHDHGELAGAVCGALGGFILATIVPATYGFSLLSAGRKSQMVISCIAFMALLGIVWIMYEHELR